MAPPQEAQSQADSPLLRPNRLLRLSSSELVFANAKPGVFHTRPLSLTNPLEGMRHGLLHLPCSALMPCLMQLPRCIKLHYQLILCLRLSRSTN